MKTKYALLMASALLLLAVSPGNGSTNTRLGHKEWDAHGMLSIKALVVAKLIRHVRERDVAYVVFENVKVVYGVEAARLLVFHNPERGGLQYIADTDATNIKQGKIYLLGLAKPPREGLAFWTPMDGLTDEKTVEKKLIPFNKLKASLKLDPWEAIEIKDLVIHGSTLAYYNYHASKNEIETLLKEYINGKNASHVQRVLAAKTLKNAIRSQHKIPFEILSAIIGMELGDGRARNMRIMIRARAVELLGNLKTERADKQLAALVKHPESSIRWPVLHIMRKRKIAGSQPGLRAVMAGLPSKYEPHSERYLAARALVVQKGVDAVGDILDVLKGDPVSDVKLFFYVLAENVSKRHIPALRKLDNTSARRHHARIAELLMCAGDPDANAEYFRLIKKWDVRELPDVTAPRLLRYPARYQPAARWYFESKHYKVTSGFQAAAKVLTHRKDPILGDLLMALLDDKHRNVDALQCLAYMGDKKYRGVFEKYTANDKPEMRLYAYAGLAQLGDRDAQLKVIRIAVLAPTGGIRYHAIRKVVPHLGRKKLIELWQEARPKKPDNVEKAVYEYVLKQFRNDNEF